MKKKQNKKQLFALTFAVLGALIWAMSPLISSGAANTLFGSGFLAASDSVIQASLSGSPINNVTPFGNAEYRVSSNGSRRFKTDVFQVSLPEGTVLTVTANNAPIAQITLNAFGGASLDLRTDNGQTVPTVSNGSQIAVLNGTTAVLSGTFGVTTGSPSPTVSPTGSPSGTASPSPTGSPNGSPSPTASPTGTASPSPTGTPTGSPSPTGTPSGSPSPTVTPIGTPTGSPSPTVSPSPSPNGGDLFAQLSGAPINGGVPAGFSEYSLHQSGTNRRVRVFVNSISLPAGTVLNVEVGGVQLGQFTLQNNGYGEFRIESRDNPIVPVVTSGTPINIRNGGATILSGAFTGGISPSPSPSPSASPSPSPTGSPTGSPTPSPSPSPTASPSARFFDAELRGSQVVPQVNSDARGNARILLNDAGNQIQVIVSFFGLNGNQTTATISGPALPGTTGVEIFNLGTIGGTSGFFPTRTYNITPAQLAQLRAGTWYVQIGSASYPDGEIRGQARSENQFGDFEGDGKADLAVFRPSEGNWYFLNSSDGAFRAQTFGSSSDKVVSSDYDGDGVSDIAIFRNINGYGYWSLKRSSDGVVTTLQWGLGDDKPVAADFDGDGRADIAVFRPSDGNWYIQRSFDNAFQALHWGAAEDIPVPSDFDGDGRADVAVYRPSLGAWYILRTSNNQFQAAYWGTNGDIPSVGDFDGDGQSDYAVFRPSDGNWYIRRSIDGSYRAIQFGAAGDIPVAGEFDADGKTDVAVFRPSNGTWYIIRSTTESFDYIQFGANGDRPALAK